jgi:hypothetical protein
MPGLSPSNSAIRRNSAFFAQFGAQLTEWPDLELGHVPDLDVDDEFMGQFPSSPDYGGLSSN